MKQRIIKSPNSDCGIDDTAGLIGSDHDGKLIRKAKNGKVSTELVSFDALPEYMKDNEFIRNHYRCEWPLKDVALSIFSVHNETLNIWTHLLGFLIFAGLTAMSLTDKTTVENLISACFRSAGVGPLRTVTTDKSNGSLAFFLVAAFYSSMSCSASETDSMSPPLSEFQQDDDGSYKTVLPNSYGNSSIEMDLDAIIKIVTQNSLEDITESHSIANLSDDFELNNELPQPTTDSSCLLSLLNDSFSSREELLENVRKVTGRQGYVIVIKTSKKDRVVVIGCDRGGKYRGEVIPEEKRKRLSASRRINCPFQLRGRRKVDGLWKLESKTIQHNHPPSSDMSGHPYCRRFSDEEMQRIREMSKSGIAPRQILTSLRQSNPNLLAISRTVYNAKLKLRKESLNGRTTLQALFDEFSATGFVYDIQRDHGGRLTHLFFAHPYSLVLTKNYPTVFVMDCTYKTNKYKMSLLEVIGMSSFNTSFFSCFVAMEKEEEMDYIWALERFKKIFLVDEYPSVIVTDRELALMNAIGVVFPGTVNLLCVWHIEKNILSKCKKFFEEKKQWDDFISSWTNLIKSSTELIFEDAMISFMEIYMEKPIILDYLRTTWLPFKEKFVYAWTEKHLHFGNHVSSRAEGAHSVLKNYLQVSTGDFYELKMKICLAIENQFREIKARLASEKVQIPHTFRIPLFNKLLTHVSRYALQELFKQYKLATSGMELSKCTCHFQNSMGLPCAHKMQECKTGVLELVDIHPQWRLDQRSFDKDDSEDDQFHCLLKAFEDKYQAMSLSQKEITKRHLSVLGDSSIGVIHEPNVSFPRGRPSSSSKRKQDNSTKRNPSMFEIVEKVRKCSTCHSVGHNTRTCRRRVEGDAVDDGL